MNCLMGLNDSLDRSGPPRRNPGGKKKKKGNNALLRHLYITHRPKISGFPLYLVNAWYPKVPEKNENGKISIPASLYVSLMVIPG